MKNWKDCDGDNDYDDDDANLDGRTGKWGYCVWSQ